MASPAATPRHRQGVQDISLSCRACPDRGGPALLQTFYLTSEHRAMLKEEEGVESWHFEQHAFEAVFIPAGCPHQVSSGPCLKTGRACTGH